MWYWNFCVHELSCVKGIGTFVDMSVEQTNTIDFMGIDKSSNTPVLTISDHLDWSDPHQHLSTLQEKINTYLSYIESGEILELYPEAENKRCLIRITSKHNIPEEAVSFVNQVKEMLKETNIDIEQVTMDK